MYIYIDTISIKMGCRKSKIHITNNSDYYPNYDLIDVKFVNLHKKKHINQMEETTIERCISPEELNNILGEDIPRLYYEDTGELLYCVLESCNVEEIVEQYGYKVVKIHKSQVPKCYFNSRHTPIHFFNRQEYYELILDLH